MSKYLVVYYYKERSAEIEAENLKDLYFKIFKYFGGFYGLNEKQTKMLCDDFTIEQFLENFESKHETINAIYEIQKTIYKEKM